MNEFAIVSEGVTDYSVLKNILIGFFKEQEIEPILNAAQPDSNANGESSWQQFGNWENVLRFLNEKKHRDALEYAEFLIVQIDTDQSEHVNFGVSQREKNQPLPPPALITAVADKLLEIIGPEDVSFYGDRIIFAICVREVECWLLPLWDAPKAAKCEGCTRAVDRALVQANHVPLSKLQENYHSASKEYLKRKVLLAEGRKNPSLGIFLSELERRNILLSAE